MVVQGGGHGGDDNVQVSNTKLGCLVKEGKVNSIEESFLFPSLCIGKCIDSDYAATEDNVLILIMANDL